MLDQHFVQTTLQISYPPTISEDMATINSPRRQLDVNIPPFQDVLNKSQSSGTKIPPLHVATGTYSFDEIQSTMSSPSTDRSITFDTPMTDSVTMGRRPSTASVSTSRADESPKPSSRSPNVATKKHSTSKIIKEKNARTKHRKGYCAQEDVMSAICRDSDNLLQGQRQSQSNGKGAGLRWTKETTLNGCCALLAHLAQQAILDHVRAGGNENDLFTSWGEISTSGWKSQRPLARTWWDLGVDNECCPMEDSAACATHPKSGHEWHVCRQKKSNEAFGKKLAACKSSLLTRGPRAHM